MTKRKSLKYSIQVQFFFFLIFNLQLVQFIGMALTEKAKCILKVVCKDWKLSLEVEHLFNMHEALDSIPVVRWGELFVYMYLHTPVYLYNIYMYTLG